MPNRSCIRVPSSLACLDQERFYPQFGQNPVYKLTIRSRVSPKLYATGYSPSVWPCCIYSEHLLLPGSRKGNMLAARRLQASAFAPSLLWKLQLGQGRVYVTMQRVDLSASTLPESSIYISTSTSPYYNLSLEDW